MQVQKAHMQVARHRPTLPRPALPVERGDVTVEQVLAASPGETRDQEIKRWCAAVWAAYHESQPLIRGFVKAHLDVS